MSSIGLSWEPQSMVSLEDLEDAAIKLTDRKGNVSILKNGTLLFVKKRKTTRFVPRNCQKSSGIYIIFP